VDRAWFEMADVRKRQLETSVWIPLRSVQKLGSVGTYGQAGFMEDFFGAGSVAVALQHRTAAEKLGWADVGIAHEHHAWVDGRRYVPADVCEAKHLGFTAVPLALDMAAPDSPTLGLRPPSSVGRA
jgi:hypothetical protein